MNNIMHKNLADGRWQAMSLAEQLANVGSEFERAWSWRLKEQDQLSQNAIDRMLELMDLTISDKRWRGARLRELTRLREEICRELMQDNSTVIPSDLQNYFLAFAVSARMKK